METSGNEGKMEGWLCLIRLNRLGLQYSRRRYLVLENNCLKSFKSIPTSESEEPVRSALIDSCIRVVDNGRESHHRKQFFIFTLYNTSNHNDKLKLGATSAEEAARWIRSLQDAAMKPLKDSSSSVRKYQPFSMSVSKRRAKRSNDWTKKSIDWTSSSPSGHVDAMTSDVIGPSPWKIFGCNNGLRLFKEADDRDSNGKHWEDHPAIMAVGAIDGASETVFRTLTSLSNSRTEWDFSFYKGSVVEHLDGHTDIIHLQLYNHWLPWGMKRRDLLLRRYWRREDDGTYVVLYHSVFHRKCPPQKGYVRACVKSGGYVITPMNQGKECVIKHMVAVDWKFWKSYIKKSSERSITIRMIGKIAALRELFKAKPDTTVLDFLSGEFSIDIGIPENENEEIKAEVGPKKIDETSRELSGGSSTLVSLNDADDEFFDVPEPSDEEPESCYVDAYTTKSSTTANFVKKLHGLTAQKKGYVDLQEMSCSYGDTLPKDLTSNMPCSWAAADVSSFLIRGDNYLEDRKKIKAKGTLMEMVGADWLRSDKREDNIAGRYGSIVQKSAARGGPEFFVIVNMQVPGSTTHSMALYYMLKSPLEETPLLERFVNGDDAFRNSRFKLIPYILKGSWIVKQSVGRKACLIGQALEVSYYRGENYLEIDIDVGSSTVAKGVVSLVLGYLTSLVVEMAFLIQGNTPEELPEFLLGTVRFNHIDASKAVSTDSIRDS